MTVEVNEQKVTLPEGATLKEAISASNIPHKDGTAIGILKEITERKGDDIISYTIITPKGEFSIELEGTDETSKKIWAQHYKDYEGAHIRWINKDAVAFGPFGTDMRPTRGAKNFERFEVVFGAGGFDPKNTHLIFTKNRHTSDYGAPENGAFAKIISGKNVLLELNKSDAIIHIEPVIEWEQMAERICTTDLSTKLDDGVKIFTNFEVELVSAAPNGAEHFLSLTRDGTFKVGVVSSSFISDDNLQGEICDYENFEPRVVGTVSIRTVGNGNGRAYISCDDRTSSIMHSVVGHVTKGIELIKLAQPGQQLDVETIPRPITILGMSFKEAEEQLSETGVKLVRDGHTEDDAIIVTQTPPTTIEILGAAKVKAFGVPNSKLVMIELYDDLAPKTLDFFRHALGLQFKPVGPLPVLMTYENTYIFKAEREAEKYKEIMPENSPKNKVLSGEIGVTNQSAKRMGMVGVKTEDDDLFGPTGEKFTSTNIIGRILDINKLKHFKDGDIMYVAESIREEK
ncbi:MAG: methyl-coenzyme M reductase-associated protein Mmp3 [Methanosarcinaceae archaeon]